MKFYRNLSAKFVDSGKSALIIQDNKNYGNFEIYGKDIEYYAPIENFEKFYVFDDTKKNQ